MTDVETDILHDAIRRLRDQGKGIVYISHRLSEIFESRFRDPSARRPDGCGGAHGKGHRADLIHRMWPQFTDNTSTPTATDPSACVSITCRAGDRDISFEAHAGEVPGICSTDGAAAPDSAELFTGLFRRAGSIELEGGNFAARLRQRRRRHRPTCPRIGESEAWSESVPCTIYDAHGIAHVSITALGLIAHRRQDKVVADYIKAFTIRTPRADAVVGTLSGGNQKVLSPRP